MRTERVTLRDIRYGESFYLESDGKIRAYVVTDICSAFPKSHVHLGQDCYWLNGPVYRVLKGMSARDKLALSSSYGKKA